MDRGCFSECVCVSSVSSGPHHYPALFTHDRLNSSSSCALRALEGCEPEQEACTSFLVTSCRLSVLPVVIVKGLFSIIVFLLFLFLNNLHITWEK